MRKYFPAVALVAALFCTTLPLAAATPSEFYSSLLRRGVAAYETGRYDEAARHLRFAAFGYVDSIEPYQTAQVYLALTHQRLDEQDRAREAVRRVLQAERIERRFARLSIPPSVRTAFEKVASANLSAAELAGLRGTADLPPPSPQPSSVRTTTTGVAIARPQQQTPAQTSAGTTTAAPDRTTTSTTAAPATTPPVVVDRIDVQIERPAQTQAAQREVTPPVTTTPARTTTSEPASQPAPRPTTGTTTTPITARPSTTPPRAQAATATRTTYSASELATRFASAERALNAANLAAARRLYRELLASVNSADHATAIRIAEGFYRARDFPGALAAFERAGGLRRGEEPYRYYVAVALYETGQYERARRELAAALPYIEVTPDVERYRLKIQSAVQ